MPLTIKTGYNTLCCFSSNNVRNWPSLRVFYLEFSSVVTLHLLEVLPLKLFRNGSNLIFLILKLENRYSRMAGVSACLNKRLPVSLLV